MMIKIYDFNFLDLFVYVCVMERYFILLGRGGYGCVYGVRAFL